MSENSPAPSRKRSKWDESDEVPVESTLIVKKRAKIPKHTRISDSSGSPLGSSSPPPSTIARDKSNCSAFVPTRTRHPLIIPSRSVYNYERLNSIEEGSYGVVFRARDKTTGDIVALKKLKLEEEKQGFPITALREINALMTCRHENVVRIREVVVGDTLTQYV